MVKRMVEICKCFVAQVLCLRRKVQILKNSQEYYRRSAHYCKHLTCRRSQAGYHHMWSGLDLVLPMGTIARDRMPAGLPFSPESCVHAMTDEISVGH